jgi:phosphatidylinositol alpha-mannosyltransferase
MDVLIGALERLAPDRPGLRLLVAGRGEAEDFLDGLPPAVAGRVTLLGQVSEEEKARLLRSVDLYCAPNTGQESFGVILLEAMSARAPIVASELEAFRRVLTGGVGAPPAGELFAVGDAADLAAKLASLLDDPGRRAELAEVGQRYAAPYDWDVVVHSVVRVYELAIAGAGLPPSGALRG